MAKIENKYNILDKIQLGWWLLRTKCEFRNARLFRRPFDIRGRKYIDWGIGLTTGKGCRFEAFSTNNNIVMRFGENIQINDYVHICAMENVRIGNNVLIASHVYISDNSHGCYKGDTEDSSPEIPPLEREYLILPVIIEDNVWIGEHVVILPGVTIGKGSIIGANSVVSISIPQNSIAVGAPARVIKQYNFKSKTWERYVSK